MRVLRLAIAGCLALTLGCGRQAPAPGGVGEMHVARLGHTMTRLADGRVLVAGGLQNVQSLLPPAATDIEIFDPVTRRFDVVGSMPTVRAMHTATLLADPSDPDGASGSRRGGRIVFIGGSPGTTVDIFDPASGRLEPGGNLLDQRGIHTATLLADGRILLVGGMKEVVTIDNGTFNERRRYLKTIEVYDPAAKSSRAFPVGLMIARRGHTASLLDDPSDPDGASGSRRGGRVLIIGGTGSPRTEVIDPARGTVEWGPSLVFAREDHRATRLVEGRWLITGGSDPNGKSLDVAEIYDPKTNRFRALSSRMCRKREDHTADLLPDGRVLITGGEDNQAGPDKSDITLDDVEIFDPRTERFAQLAPLSRPRDDHRSAPLPGGAILITGGEDDSDVGTATAEIIAPPAR